jgi:hypothetical protein
MLLCRNNALKQKTIHSSMAEVSEQFFDSCRTPLIHALNGIRNLGQAVKIQALDREATVTGIKLSSGSDFNFICYFVGLRNKMCF